MYPKLLKDNTLVFASEGHKGYGGLDVYSVVITEKSVGLAINMGSSINSNQNEFTLQIEPQNGMAYVVSNRTSGKNSVRKIAYTYLGEKRNATETDFRLLEALHTSGQENYSSSVFEDE
jgi:hypothetical protein